jgi:Ca2+-binding EF-hand superfamily protein
MGHAAQLDNARVPKNVLKRFDANKNGVLDPAERTKARAAAMRRRRSNEPSGDAPTSGRALLKKFDRDGDGKLNEQERRAMRRELARRAVGNSNRRRKGRGQQPPQVELPARVTRVDLTELLSAFDVNGDGKLTGRERAQALREYRAKR